jgi:hypothetical protein
MQVESYCLRIASRGPVGGDGYLNAPLKGGRAAIVRSILQNTWRHPEIPQRTIQLVIWAILARAEYNDLRPDLQAAARALLTAAEIKSIGRSPWDALDTSLGRRAIAGLPAPARQALRAERNLRDMLRRANYTYEDFERLAMTPIGADEPTRREVPRGRWMHHPDGFLIRYLPRGYTSTRVEILVPHAYTVRRDRIGRILSIADGRGNRTETEYDDTVAPLNVPGEPRLKGFAFRVIRVTAQGPNGPETHEIRGRGWTFVRTRREPPRQFLLRPVAWSAPLQNLYEQFQQWRERYEAAREPIDDINYYRERIEHATGEPDDSAIDDLENMEHYRDGIETAATGDTGERLDWIIQEKERENDALRHAIVVINTLPTTSTAEPDYAPWGGVAVPTHSASQRLGMSGR